jgi:hypothetical protein
MATRVSRPAVLDADNAAFIVADGISCSIAARVAANRPSVGKALAVRVSGDRRRLEVFVDAERCAEVVRDLRPDRDQQRVETVGAHPGAHAGQQLGPLGGCHGRDHPSHEFDLQVRRDRRRQALLQLEQFGVAVFGPQHRVVVRLLHFHVGEVVRDELRQQPVQAVCGGRPLCAQRGLDVERGTLQQHEVLAVMRVVARRLGRRARPARLHGGVQVGFLVLEVHAAQRHQRTHVGQRGGGVLGVERVQPPRGGERMRQAGAQPLVRESVDVETAARVGHVVPLQRMWIDGSHAACVLRTSGGAVAPGS